MSTPIRRCGTGLPSAATSSPVLGRELGPDAAARLHRGEERLLRLGLIFTTDLDQQGIGAGMSGRVAGRVAVITGGCSGIGLASARRLAAEGGHRGDRRPRRDPRSGSGRGTGRRVPADRRHRRRAGRSPVRPCRTTASAPWTSRSTTPASHRRRTIRSSTPIWTTWRRVQEVNLTSVYLCCRTALPYMLQQHRGSIINTASFVAVMGAATSQISYSASKGGVLSLSRELGRAVRPLRRPRQRVVSRPGQHADAAGAVRQPIPSAPPAGSCTYRWGGSPNPRRSPTPCCSWPRTNPAYVNASTFLVDGGISAAYVTPL